MKNKKAGTSLVIVIILILIIFIVIGVLIYKNQTKNNSNPDLTNSKLLIKIIDSDIKNQLSGEYILEYNNQQIYNTTTESDKLSEYSVPNNNNYSIIGFF